MLVMLLMWLEIRGKVETNYVLVHTSKWPTLAIPGLDFFMKKHASLIVAIWCDLIGIQEFSAIGSSREEPRRAMFRNSVNVCLLKPKTSEPSQSIKPKMASTDRPEKKMFVNHIQENTRSGHHSRGQESFIHQARNYIPEGETELMPSEIREVIQIPGKVRL